MSFLCLTCKVRRKNNFVIDHSITFIILGELESIVKKIEGLLPGNHKAKFRENVNELRSLIGVSKHIGIHHKIVFHPLLVYELYLKK
jgi:translation initiation factor 2-alpha kinase 4